MSKGGISWVRSWIDSVSSTLRATPYMAATAPSTSPKSVCSTSFALTGAGSFADRRAAGS